VRHWVSCRWLTTHNSELKISIALIIGDIKNDFPCMYMSLTPMNYSIIILSSKLLVVTVPPQENFDHGYCIDHILLIMTSWNAFIGGLRPSLLKVVGAPAPLAPTFRCHWLRWCQICYFKIFFGCCLAMWCINSSQIAKSAML